jgi:hypothetical protein
MTTTFDSVTLVNPSPQKLKVTNSEVFEIAIDCLTDSYADITAIKAKAGIANKTTLVSGKTSIQTTGTKGSLVLEGDTYTNCVIMEPVQVEELEGSARTWWKYRVSIAQDTS